MTAKPFADGPTFFVRMLRVEPERFETLYRDIASFLRDEAPAIDGFVDAELFGGENATTILLIVRWSSRKAWSRAQWDVGLARIVEEIYSGAQTLAFDLCSAERFSRFAQAATECVL